MTSSKQALRTRVNKRAETRGEKVIRFLSEYVLTPEGEHVGKPLQLADFQKRFLLDLYDNPAGTRRAYLSIARKNGKSGLLAGILLAHIIGPERIQNSQIVSGARSRDQAALIYDLASKMLNLQPKFQGLYRLVPSSKRIIGLKANVEYKALAADGTTAHGLSPVLAILDEVGQVRGPQDDFIDAITTAQGAHKSPLLIAISTQSANDADLFSQWLDDAARSKDPKIISHVYSAKKEAAVTDPQAWKDANPALGLFRSLADVEEQAKQAARMPSAENTFRNLILNQRVSTVVPFISKSVWDANAGNLLPFKPITTVWAGLDLSGRTDLTSLVLVGKVGDAWQIHPYFWTPEGGLIERSKRDRQPYDVWVREGYIRTTPGNTVDYDFVAKEIIEIVAELDLHSIAYDRWRINIFRKALDAQGADLPLVEWGQGFKDMSPAIELMEAKLLNEEISHGNNPVMTMCAANAILAKDPAGNRKLDKHKATGRIDGIVAMAMAFGVGEMHMEEEERDFQLFVI
jgi:phage terminase large subunit-like protein